MLVFFYYFYEMIYFIVSLIIFIIIIFIVFKRYIYSANKKEWRNSNKFIIKKTVQLMDWLDGKDLNKNRVIINYSE